MRVRNGSARHLARAQRPMLGMMLGRRRRAQCGRSDAAAASNAASSASRGSIAAAKHLTNQLAASEAARELEQRDLILRGGKSS